MARAILIWVAAHADGRHEAKVVLYKFYIRQAKDAEWDEPVLLTLHGNRRPAQKRLMKAEQRCVPL